MENCKRRAIQQRNTVGVGRNCLPGHLRTLYQFDMRSLLQPRNTIACIIPALIVTQKRAVNRRALESMKGMFRALSYRKDISAEPNPSAKIAARERPHDGRTKQVRAAEPH